MDSTAIVSTVPPLKLVKYWCYVFYLCSILSFVVPVLYVAGAIMDKHDASLLIPPLIVVAILTISGNFIMLRGLRAPMEPSSGPPILKQIKVHFMFLTVLGTIWMSLSDSDRQCYYCAKAAPQGLHIAIIILCAVVFIEYYLAALSLKLYGKENEGNNDPVADAGLGPNRSSGNDTAEAGLVNASQGIIKI